MFNGKAVASIAPHRIHALDIVESSRSLLPSKRGPGAAVGSARAAMAEATAEGSPKAKAKKEPKEPVVTNPRSKASSIS